MKTKYNTEIKFLMQGRYVSGSTYKYHLVDENLVEDKQLILTVSEAEVFALSNNIKRISSGSMTILRSEKWK